ncbi:MAG: GntR family transcriptional regulator [Bacteroidetes bacterium]|nr:MAG: GntR family transcriptional regulator [Bacteroidota bacterium]
MHLRIDHSSPVPLHRQVELLLREMIEDPVYKQGKLLPKEVDLAKRLGISRNTIRQATNKLVNENLLIRKKGVGTKVSVKNVTTHLNSWFSFSQEMHDQGMKLINYNIEARWVAASAEVALHLEMKEGKEVLMLERLRGRTNGPFVRFISFFHPRIGLTGKEDFSQHLYEILETQYSTVPSISKEEIKAILADKELAGLLNTEIGAPILFRKRVVSDPGNRPFEYNVGYYRADRFTYAIDIKRENGQ